MSLRQEHREILEILSLDEWRQVPEYRDSDGVFQYVAPFRHRFRIPGQKARLKELMELGYVHVRTTTYAPWGNTWSPTERKADPHPKYPPVQWQALLTPQGADVLAAHS